MSGPVRLMAVRKSAGEKPALPVFGNVLDIIGPKGTIARQFNGYEAREPQLRLSLAIEQAINERRHFVGQAGTGVGKSFAYSAPATASKRRTVIAVPTIALMDQLLGKDMPFLSTDGVIPGGFKYALLKGRGNYLCVQKYKSLTTDRDGTEIEPSFADRDAATSWPAVKAWADETEDGDVGKLSFPLPMAIRTEVTSTSDDCLGESCPSFGECFAEAAKDRAARADVIVTNYALLMRDLMIRAGSGGMATLFPDGIETLVLDECHKLEDEASNAFQKEVKAGRLAWIAQRIERLAKRAAGNEVDEDGAPVALRTGKSVDEWAARIHDAQDAFRSFLLSYYVRLGHADKERKNPDTKQRLGDERELAYDALLALESLRIATKATPAGLTDEGDRKAWEKLPELINGLIDDVYTVASPERDTDVVRFVTIEEAKSGLPADGVILTVAPIDVAPILRESLWSTTFYKPVDEDGEDRDYNDRLPLTVICVSATIATADGLGFWRSRVGLDSADELIVDSPFNYAEHMQLYVPRDAAAFDATAARGPQGLSKEYLDRLSCEFGRLIMASNGGAFCLFTSNRVLDYVYNRITPKLISRGFLVLRQGEAGQGELVRRFREDGNAVLFGVKSFWEGVDVQGDALRLVAINGMPFTPPDDPIFAAKCEQLDRKYGRMASFRMLSIPMATIALQQAAGRLIRSKTDTGVVAILDGRLRSKPYGASVVRSMPPAPVTGDIEAVKAFYSR